MSRMKIFFLFLFMISARLNASQPVGSIGEAVDFIANNLPGNTGTLAADRGEIRSFEFSEADVNKLAGEWLKRNGGRPGNGGMTVRSVAVRLLPKHVVQADAVAAFNSEILTMLGPEQDSLLGRLLKKCIGVQNSLHVEFLISSAKGTAFVKILKVSIKGITLPEPVVERAVIRIGERQSPPMDLNRPVPLPNGIDKIDILPGRLWVRVKTF